MTHTFDFVVRGAADDTATAIRDYAARRLSFALRRFERRIDSVKVRVRDLNGPRRGVDARCSMIAQLVGGRQVVVEATTEAPFSSVTRAAARLRDAVAHELGRARVSRRAGHTLVGEP